MYRKENQNAGWESHRETVQRLRGKPPCKLVGKPPQDKPYTGNTQRVKDEQTIPAMGKYKQDTISDLTQYKTVRLR